MNGRDYGQIAIGLAVVLACAAGILANGCGKVVLPASKRAEVLSCLDLANAALEEAETCEQARVALAKAVQAYPMCQQLFGAQIRVETDAGAMLPCEDL